MALPKVLEKLPPNAANLVVQCLRKKHPTAVLISKLGFDHSTDPHERVPALNVTGPGLRVSGERYGRIASVDGYTFLPDEFGGWMQRFFYDPKDGEPLPGWSHTPTPWLENWDADLLEEIEMDEEMRERLREIWD
jgi:hypothetical protein